MKYINFIMDIKDTVKGEIYTCVSGDEVFIYTCGEKGKQQYLNYICSSCSKKEFKSLSKPSGFSWGGLRESTPQEKHWLKTCLGLNKGIYFEDAMKSFNTEPQYEIY